MKILVTGGTGTLGRPTVAALRADGYTARVLSRTVRPDRPEIVVGDLLTGAGIDAALTDTEVVVHCATTAFDRRGRFGGKEIHATRVLVDAIGRQPRPRHLVYISIVGIDAVPLPYYRAKLACEELIVGSGVPWTILRATQFHDLVARIVALPLPVTVVPSRTSFQPIDASDVATRLAELAAAAPAGRVPDIGGPAVRPIADLARTHHHILGMRRPVLSLRLPGRIAGAYRSGAHTCPENPYGNITFEAWLTGRKPAHS